jgi:hypothetical protein
MNVLERFKPSIPKRGLFFIAATVWAVAGGMLAFRGYGFIMEDASPHTWRFFWGVLGGLVFFLFLFDGISRKHIQRISALKSETPCVFSFFNWKSYALMGIMIASGIATRYSRLLPLSDLGTFYIAMGVPLLASSIRFSHMGFTYGSPPAAAGRGRGTVGQ